MTDSQTVIIGIFAILLSALFFGAIIFITNIKENAEEDYKKPTVKQATIKQYHAKPYMTKTERAFGNALYKALPAGYTLMPQVCLASIIHKNFNNKYINELFKIIDFGVFDANYKPVVLIEINDDTHKTGERIKRDKKIKELCAEAEIPLITLWTEYGIKEEYIKKRLEEYCK